VRAILSAPAARAVTLSTGERERSARPGAADAPERDLERPPRREQVPRRGEHAVVKTLARARNGYRTVTCAGMPYAAEES